MTVQEAIAAKAAVIAAQGDDLDTAIAAIAGKAAGVNTENKTYSIVNDAVADYLENANYSASDYTSSYFDTHTVESRGDRPSGTSVTLLAGELVVSDYKNTTKKTVSAGSSTIDCVAPGTNAGIFVASSSGVPYKSGLLTPTGALRMINGGGNTYNIRDLGGWACDGASGETARLKYGKIFRGCELNGENNITLTNEQIAFFRDYLGIRDEIDLRDNTETDMTSDPLDDITSSALGDSVDYVKIPVSPYSAGVNTAAKTQMSYYCALFKRIAKDLAENKPIYIHCVAGADRTGTVCGLIEAICGVGQTDCDKDYEITSFALGNTRKRNTDSDNCWKTFINRIWGNGSGGENVFVGSTFRDRVVSFLLQAGVSIEEINTIRQCLIDGTPTDLISPYTAKTVTRTLTNTTIDNNASTVAEYQPYEANIKAAEGKVISSLSISMGGVDITRTVFNGTRVNLLRQVTLALTNCTLNNGKSVVVDGEGYAAVVTPGAGYTLEETTVTITMGGVNVTSNYYSDGKIFIPSVTGDLVITATAESQALVNLFDSTKAELNKRINSSGETTSYGSAQLVTDYIAVTPSDVIKLVSDLGQDANNYTGMIAFYDSSKSYLAQINNVNSNWSWETGNEEGEFAVADGSSSAAFVRICIAYTDINNIAIYLNA